MADVKTITEELEASGKEKENNYLSSGDEVEEIQPKKKNIK